MPISNFHKKKNLLDLKHNRIMTYFSIVAISIVTITFTIVWSFLSKATGKDITTTAIIIDGALSTIILIIIFSKLAETKKEIEEL